MQSVGVGVNPECLARREDDTGSGVTDIGQGQDTEMLSLILRWARLVSLHYGVEVDNFTVSFSDGRALCCLLHHYHPALLPLDEISFHTSGSVREEAEREGEEEGDADLSQDWGAEEEERDPELYQRLLANEKANFKTLYEKVRLCDVYSTNELFSLFFLLLLSGSYLVHFLQIMKI